MTAVRMKGASQTLWEAYPESLIDVAAAVTELGGAEVLVLVLALAYWLTDRERVARVAMFAIAGIAVVIILKSAFALPRPVEDGTAATVYEHSDDQYGFPSGHAFMSVAVYGGFLYVFDKLRDVRWVVGIGVLITSVAFSRIFLRVHYLGDIMIGAILGVAFVIGMNRVGREDLRIGFGISVVLALIAVVISGDTLSLVAGEEYAYVGLGSGLGGLLGVQSLDVVPELESRIEAGLLVVFGLGYVIVIMGVYLTVVGEATTALENGLVAGFHFVLIGGVFVAPIGVHKVNRQRKQLLGAKDPQ
jgi:hypothetical protein